ncbi:MAG TPA: hypothetical protein VH297_09640 [Gaiellaceae bacterium]|jgi:hypothetical protein
MRDKPRSKHHPEPRLPFITSTPPTAGELAASSAAWERRGLLGRLIRRG